MSTTPEQLEACLLQLLAPDTSLIKQAEAHLKEYSKTLECVNGLMNQIQSSQHQQVRQMASIILRKKINSHWPKLDATTQNAIKTTLLSRAADEPERLVRKGICSLIAAVSKHQLPAGEWPELLQFINKCTQSPSEDHREAAMILFHYLTETVGGYLEPHFQEIKGLFANALQDPQSIKVRKTAMRASCSLLEYLSMDDEVLQFQELLPSMMEVLKICIQNNDESDACEFLDMFNDIAESPMPILNLSLVPFVHILLQIMLNDNLELSTRDSAALVVGKLLENKPKTVGKKELVKDILNVLFQIITKDNSSAGGILSSQFNDEGDDDEETPTQIAQRTLDTMALNMPAKYFDHIVMGMISECINSQDPSTRKTGVVSLGVIAEGCADRLLEKIDGILPHLYSAAKDQFPLLREAACFSLGQWAEHLQPNILEHYETLLPVVFQLLDDQTPSVQGTSCYVLECFTENMDPEAVLPYLEPLMTKLVQLLTTSKPQIQLLAISAIGSTAIGAESAFVPYFPTIAQMLPPFLELQDEKYIALRGRSLECLGYMAIAVGREAFRPYFESSMQYAIQSAAVKDMELSDYSFAFFCNISKVFEEEFTPYLNQVIPLLHDALKMEDGITVNVKGGDANQLAAFDDEEDDDSDPTQRGYMSVRTAMLDMKQGAVGAIEAVAEHTGAYFEPFIPSSIEILSDMTEYFHEKVREHVAGALCQMVLCSLEAKGMTSNPAQGGNGMNTWVKGKPYSITLDTSTAQLLESVMLTFMNFMEDADTIVVEKAMECITKLCLRIGPIVTANYMHPLIEIVIKLLSEKHDCQQTLEDEENPEESEEDEAGSIFETTCELIVSQTKCYGAEIDQFVESVLPWVHKYTKGVRPGQDRAVAFGSIAETLQEIGTAGVKYCGDLIPLAVRGLADEHSNVQQNCAFLLGILAEVGGSSVASSYPSMLQGLHPLFQLSEKEKGGVKDNATAAISRMIMANPSAIPFEQVIPVLLDALPLKTDISESTSVFKCLIGLLQQEQAEVMNRMPQVVNIYAQVLDADYDVDEAVQAEVTQSLKNLMVRYEAQMKPLVEGLDPALKSVLVASLQQ